MLKLAVIGDPIEHSLSPAIHEKILNQLGIEHEYKKIRVEKGRISDFLKFAREERINAFNVTMPHKTDIISYIDVMSPEAKLYCSVNTVVCKDNKLYGYSTDAEGYIKSLSEINFHVGGKNIVVLGAGGVVNTLAKKFIIDNAACVTILNRTVVRAEILCRDAEASLNLKSPSQLKYGSLYDVGDYTESADLLVNATPLGMSGVKEDFKDFSFLLTAKKSMVVSDLIYNPAETVILKNARALGFRTVNGMSMLINQAVIAEDYFLFLREKRK